MFEYAVYVLEERIKDVKNFKKYGLDDEGFINKIPELEFAIRILQ